MNNLSQCRAFNISDEGRCLEPATSVNGLFCTFHSKQCQGLYRGYKLRNAKLDRLTQNPPKYLAESKVQLSIQTFQDVSTHETLKEIHDHLFLKFQLLERVIRARKLHHSRFFSQDMDYGHAKFLDSLQGQKTATLKALERLERRTAEVLYKKQKWFTWVRECQDEEEQTRDKEQKKVKAEAAMFRRHWKATQLRQQDLRAKENKLRQDAFLEQIYKERVAERESNGESVDNDEDGMEWDPIEDVLEDNRGSYIDLIQTFLWMAVPESNTGVTDEEPSAVSIPIATSTPETSSIVGPDMLQEPATSKSSSPPKPKSKSKKKKTSNATPIENSKGAPPTLSEPDKSLIETRQEMYDRLKNGENFSNENVVGIMVAGTTENPVISTKSIKFPEDEIARLQDDIFQIKHLLFCRLLLGHAALLPAALRANTVEDFLADDEVTAGALRDLCLKMENPGLQEIRDACADLFRSDDETDEEFEPSKDNSAGRKRSDGRDMQVFQKKKGALPDKWVAKKEKKIAGEMGPDLDSMFGDEGVGKAVDFGRVERSSSARPRKIKLKICGRTIWNYPSNKAMTRGGWLHFCIMAKESTLHDAIALCRHWDEFFELNILSIWRYFPGTKWALWSENRWRQQLLQLGFIVFFETASPDAAALTVRRQQNNNRGQGRRSHAMFEARNFMCAHIKRDDQASRRLVQYLAMQSYRILVLVRDAETGSLLIKPPEDQRWLFREKSGLGRAVKNDWNIIKSIGPEFFEEMERHRKWSFSFKEYYDIYLWDLEAGEPFPVLYNAVQEMLIKALRCRVPVDMYEPSGPVLKTLYQDELTYRVRDIKPGDKVESIYDHFRGPDVKFRYGKVEDAWGKNASGLVRAKPVFNEDNKFPRNFFYNEIDELEDAILFPEELEARRLDPSEIGKIEPLSQWEQALTIRGFVEGWNSEDSEDTDEFTEDDFEMDEEDSFEDDGENSSNEESENGSDELAELERESSLTAEDLLQRMPWSTELKDAMTKLSLRDRPVRPLGKPTNQQMEQDFLIFIDREKAKIFKEVWHKADLTPHAQIRYTEMVEMTKKCCKYNRNLFDCAPVILAMTLEVDLDINEHENDLRKAIAKLTPFFHGDFLTSEDGGMFRESLLFKQQERAKEPRNHRSHHSNKTRPAAFFKEFELAWNATADTAVNNDELFQEWDRAIRPIIAHLYKSGIIRTRANSLIFAQAFAGKESDSDRYDFYQEQRANMEPFTMLPPMKNPHDVPSFKNFAQAFTQKYANARFAVLSLWSAPHFYPLMIGPGNHDDTSFRDLVGRTFDWKFVPKDMPNSEWSIHFVACQRIEPYKKYLGNRVVVKREKFLVMGTDEKDLFRLAAVTAFAIQTRPWRWEVDLWKSFVNVDLKFVENLDERWME